MLKCNSLVPLEGGVVEILHLLILDSKFLSGPGDSKAVAALKGSNKAKELTSELNVA